MWSILIKLNKKRDRKRSTLIENRSILDQNCDRRLGIGFVYKSSSELGIGIWIDDDYSIWDGKLPKLSSMVKLSGYTSSDLFHWKFYFCAFNQMGFKQLLPGFMLLKKV